MKRILISYFFGNDVIPLGDACARAFESLGWDVYRFNSQLESLSYRAGLKPVAKIVRAVGYRKGEWGASLPTLRDNFKRERLRQAVREFRPDWVLIIIGHEFVTAELAEELRRDEGVQQVLCWQVSGPLDSPGLLKNASIFDHYFCIHRHGYTPDDGIHYLPAHGMDFDLYRNLYPHGPRPYAHEIVFVGGRNERRQRFVDPLLDLPIELYGKWHHKNRFNWRLRARVKAKGIWGEELVRLYNTSKIVLNISGWDPIHSGLNLRVFDTPATGAFFMTDYSPELDEYYDVGREIVCFREVDELRDKLSYYLRHDAERERIAQQGYARALTLPTIKDRMQSLIRAVT